MSGSKDKINGLASRVSSLMESGDASEVFSAVNSMDPGALEGLKADVLIGNKMGVYQGDRREQIADLLTELIQEIRASDENVERSFFR